MKQSFRAWFNKLSVVLLKIGFCASKYDLSLFISHANDHTTVILVYVDDIVITGSNSDHIYTCISQLHDRFAIKDLSTLHYFLGIEVTGTPNGLNLSQTKYMKDLLTRSNMLNAKPCDTPMATGSALSLADSPLFEDPHLFQSIVGALQYATLTRPDLSFAVNKVSQFMHSPTLNH